MISPSEKYGNCFLIVCHEIISNTRVQSLWFELQCILVTQLVSVTSKSRFQHRNDAYSKLEKAHEIVNSPTNGDRNGSARMLY